MVYPAAPPGAHMREPVTWAALLNEVGISSTDLYAQIIGAIQRGSGDPALSWDGFDFEVNSVYDEATDLDALALIRKGMPPLDAIVWFSGQGRPADLQITVRNAKDDVKVVVNDIYSGFFAWYFSLYTQARSVAQGSPNFLVGVLAMTDDWNENILMLSSADIDKFPTSWVKNVDLGGLSSKSQNRLALGAAGHRYLSALKYVRPEDFKAGTEHGSAFIAGIREWTGDRVWWDLHPLTKAGDIITVTGSLNKLIEDCLFTCVKEERLAQLSRARILHHTPIAVPTHSNWTTFKLELLPELREPIF